MLLTAAHVLRWCLVKVRHSSKILQLYLLLHTTDLTRNSWQFFYGAEKEKREKKKEKKEKKKEKKRGKRKRKKREKREKKREKRKRKRRKK